jgi:tetratricopeptide (TPR) repeat protein
MKFSEIGLESEYSMYTECEFCIEMTARVFRDKIGGIVMFRTFLASVAGLMLIVCIGVASAEAQTGSIRGKVTLSGTDGKKSPAADALVESFRTDVDSGAGAPVRTNKNGEFSMIVPVGRKYVLVASGPGLAPAVARNISAGMENVEIVVYAGDGKQFTEAEVREALKQSANSKPQTEAELKKAKEEYDKQVAKYNEEKAKAENSNKIVNDSLKAGDAAFKAKDYATAIAKFDEGINADPEFEGSAPVLLNYKGVTLKTRAFEAYERASKNADAAAKAAELEKAKADFLASMEAYDRGLKILAAAKAPDAASQATYDKSKYNLLNNYIESYRLIVRTKADVSKAKEAVPVFEQYFAAETDPAKKLAARLVLADMLREAGESEPAIVAYRAVLESSPDNPDALAGIGLSLFNVGVSEDNKAKMQEGLNYMQKFADTAPDTHALKASVKDAVEYLKNEQKLAPQKTAAPKRKT